MIDDQLRRAMVDSKLSAAEIAREAKVSTRAVQRFLSGSRDLYLATAAAIADALNLQLGQAVQSARRRR